MNKPDQIKKLVNLIDLTSLNPADSKETIENLCRKSYTNFGSVASVCIYSHLIPLAKEYIAQYNPGLKIATVVNFPAGLPDIELSVYETKLAIDRGADEIDLVLPYHALMQGNQSICARLIEKIRTTCTTQILKIIIESGILNTYQLIEQASILCIENGADFIKTSTGKVAVNATLEAARTILTTIKQRSSTCGLKVSGGVKTMDEAMKYFELVQEIMGEAWIIPRHMRFGASALLDNLCLKNVDTGNY